MTTAIESDLLAELPELDLGAISGIRDWGPRGPAMFEKVVRAWLRDLPLRLDQVRGAIDTGDRKLAHCIVHSLKSCSATVGAARVAHKCSIAEAAYRVGDLETEILEEIEREFRSAATALRRLLEIGEDAR